MAPLEAFVESAAHHGFPEVGVEQQTRCDYAFLTIKSACSLRIICSYSYRINSTIEVQVVVGDAAIPVGARWRAGNVVHRPGPRPAR